MSNFLKRLKDKQVAEREEKESEKKSSKGLMDTSGPRPVDIDIYETDFEFIVIAQTPGVSADSLEVALEGDNDILVIKAIPNSSANVPELSYGEGDKKKKPKAIMSECNWNDYFRRIPLSKEVDPDGMKASINKGVLLIRLSFASSVKRKQGKKVVSVKDKESLEGNEDK